MSAPTIATRGLFIVVEGLDRAGKTTQVEQLRRRLAANRSSTAVAQASATTTPDGQSQGQDQIDVHVAKFPDRSTPTGQVLDAYLKSSAQLDDRAAHLIFSANRWEAMPKLRQLLLNGTHVIADRYAFSGVAYTGAKSSVPTTHPVSSRPDATCNLTHPEAAATRGGYGAERYERALFQQAVAKEFAGLAQVVQRSGVKWATIDASAPPDQVEQEVWKHVSALEPPNGLRMDLFHRPDEDRPSP